ncbi:MAG: hypothetical protein Q7S51_00940 [Gallionellaceae bacterium]|nr:hypothetical protein [Gallionellaceae bacterium]
MAYKLSDESRLVGNLNVGYDTQAKQAAITSSFSSFGGSTFVTNGIKPSPVVVRAGVSYEVEKANGTEIVTRYGVDTKSGYTNQMLSINWRMLF